MNRLLLIVICLVAFAGAQQTKPSEGRYQLVHAKAPSLFTSDADEPSDQIFLIDTATGRVWIFRHGPTGGEEANRIQLPGYFHRIEVEVLDGDVVRQQSKFLQDVQERRKAEKERRENAVPNFGPVVPKPPKDKP